MPRLSLAHVTLALLLLAPAPLAAQIPGSTANSNASAERQRFRAETMNEANTFLGNWRNAWTRDDIGALVELYLPDALLSMPGDSTPAQGKEQIRALLTTRLRTLGRVEVQTLDAAVDDRMVYLQQRYAVATEAAPGEVSEQAALAGTATTILEREQTGWRIRAQIFRAGDADAGAALLRTGAPTAAAAGSGLPPALRGLACASFEWLPWRGITERAVPAVSAEVNGRTLRFALDTGADQSQLFAADAIAAAGPREANGRVRLERVRVAGLELGPARLATGNDAGGGVAGVIGLDLLIHHLVVLDYPAQRICLTSSSDIPPELAGSVEWAPAEIRGGHLVIGATLGGRPLEGLYFSTGGAGALPLLTDEATWRGATGRAGEREATSRLTVPLQGRMSAVAGAPATGALELGPLKAAAPLVYFTPRAATAPAASAAPSMGNAAFADRVVVLSLGAWPAFGVLR